MGVYKEFSEVPERHALSRYEEQYAGRDVWTEWTATVTTQHAGERYAADLARTGEQWSDLAKSRKIHPALADPSTIEAFAASLLQRCSPLSAYQTYFTKLESFYTWLLYHTAHPHFYHPVWMAANEHDRTREIWDAKIARRDA